MGFGAVSCRIEMTHFFWGGAFRQALFERPASEQCTPVARQLGVSRSWASREANALGTRNLLAELLEPHCKRLNALFDQILDVIEDAMKARQFLVVNRVLVDVGPRSLRPAPSREGVYCVDVSREQGQAIAPVARRAGVNEPRGVRDGQRGRGPRSPTSRWPCRVRGRGTRRGWSSPAILSEARTGNCADVYASNPGAPIIQGAQITCSRSNWNYGRFVEPPRTFLAGVGETNMSQQLGG